MVEVFVLYLERSSYSDSPSKACMVHVVLPIAITWRGVDEPTPETLFFHSTTKKKKNESN